MSLVPQKTDYGLIMPSNYRVVSGSGAKDVVIQKIKRRVKQFKMPKAQRDKISRAARKFRAPILTGMAVAPTTISTLLAAQWAYNRTGGNFLYALSAAASQFMGNMTGVSWQYDNINNVGWNPRQMLLGLVPIGGGYLLYKSGVFRWINQQLGKAHIPARFS